MPNHALQLNAATCPWLDGWREIYYSWEICAAWLSFVVRIPQRGERNRELMCVGEPAGLAWQRQREPAVAREALDLDCERRALAQLVAFAGYHFAPLLDPLGGKLGVGNGRKGDGAEGGHCSASD